jgi:hypothetical protein
MVAGRSIDGDYMEITLKKRVEMLEKRSSNGRQKDEKFI